MFGRGPSLSLVPTKGKAILPPPPTMALTGRNSGTSEAAGGAAAQINNGRFDPPVSVSLAPSAPGYLPSLSGRGLANK
ncbi:Hypothetical protein NTJ_16095 [Nesidiocoris tenuis]|uniref:Uncharacterized protein n=1 Tax=Nesidiocoris tenuis TaxID=355587 RepID=A0ABN7BIA6_9HEMI|nr:Hypothetical protein NTJ_16095 [Nesidiocoris tenuis]